MQLYMPPHGSPSPGRQMVYMRPRRRRKRRRFRWWLVAVPVIVSIAMWVGQGISPSVSWNGIMSHTLHVRDTERCTEFVTLGVLMVSGLLIMKVLLGTRDDSRLQ